MLRRQHHLRVDAAAALPPRVQRRLPVELVGPAAARCQRRPPAEVAAVHFEPRRAAHHDAVGVEVPERVHDGLGHPRRHARPDVGVRVRRHRAPHGRRRPPVAARQQIPRAHRLRGDGVDGVAEVLGRQLRAEARAVVDGGAAKGCLVGRQAPRAGEAAPHQRGQSLEFGHGGRASHVAGRQELLPRPVLERLQGLRREVQHPLAQRRRGKPLDEPREVGIGKHDRWRWGRPRRQPVGLGRPALQQGRRRGDREAAAARNARPGVEEVPEGSAIGEHVVVDEGEEDTVGEVGDLDDEER